MSNGLGDLLYKNPYLKIKTRLLFENIPQIDATHLSNHSLLLSSLPYNIFFLNILSSGLDDLLYKTRI